MQDKVFLNGEGDAYFERNRHALCGNWSSDWPLRLINEYHLKPQRVLEVGCMNGWRLAAINATLGCHCLGIDPSPKALEDGIQRFPNVQFRIGRAGLLFGVWDLTFDLIIVHYVLHWVDRRELLISIKEIDRALVDGGYLILGDFAPDYPCKVPYKHRDGIWTYKLPRYQDLFLATGLYQELACITYNHDTHEQGPAESQQRGMCCLLSKREVYALCE